MANPSYLIDRAKVKHSSMIASYDADGLNDIKTKLKSLQLSWVKRLYDDTCHCWKVIPMFFINRYSQDLFYPNIKLTLPEDMPLFSQNIFKFLEDISKSEPITLKSVFSQSIRFNSFILIEKKPIKWKMSNVRFIKDFYDSDGRILEWNSFKFKFGLQNIHYPSTGNQIIKNNKENNCNKELPQQHLLYLTRLLTLGRLTSKQLYIVMIIKKSEKPTSESRIEKILNTTHIQWRKVYALARNVTIDNFTRQFHIKLTHNILFLNKSLSKMGISNNSLCSYFNIYDETPIHLFFHCKVVTSLWMHLREILLQAFK